MTAASFQKMGVQKNHNTQNNTIIIKGVLNYVNRYIIIY